MGSRTWIKIYCDKWISGTIREETSALRGVWADVLALAGNLNYGDIGQISLPNNIPLTDEQIANIFKISIREWRQSKSRLIATERVTVNNNIIKIVNWQKYQPEYERQKKYRQSSPEWRINYSLGVAIANSLKGQKDGVSWESLVGYTRKKLVFHLESLFQEGMTWENYGEWHIDHIIPRSNFQFNKPGDPEFVKCWALNNLQPLWKDENLSKSNKGYSLRLQSKVTSQGYGEKEKEKEKENRKEKNKTPAPSAVDLSTFPQQDKKTVEKFISEGTMFGTGRTDDKFRDEVKEVCLSLAQRCSDWGESVEDEKKFIDKFFGVVSNLMRFGLAKKPEKVTDFKGNPTSKTKMKKLISRMSKPRNLVAELIDAVKKQPKYLL